jgi:cobaltochelatase CobT
MNQDLEVALSSAARALAGTRHLAVRTQAHAPLADPLAAGEEIILPLPQAGAALSELRGAADLAAWARRHHEKTLHRRLRPRARQEAEALDALELMRVALRGGAQLPGAARNVARYMARRCAEREYAPATPPLPEILAFLLRQRVTGAAPPAPLEPLMVRFAPQILERAEGEMCALAASLADQARFAAAAHALFLRLSGGEEDAGERAGHTLLSETAPQEAEGETPDTARDEEEGGLVEETGEELSPQTGRGEEGERRAGAPRSGRADLLAEAAGGDAAATPETPPWPHDLPASGYRVFTARHDEIIPAHRLASREELARLRTQLDAKLAQFGSSSARWAARLQRVLLARGRRAWEYDLEEGMIHPARLARLVASPSQNRVFRREKESEFRDTVVTLLIDNSGSMRGRPIVLAAIAADVLARTLERAGVRVEILGFTTREWKGGDAAREWVRAGKPAHPGRLADLRHVIYKAADMPFSRARKNLGLMLKDGLLKENIDGEALLWAHHRLVRRREERRILMVISDGAPVDDATLSANGASYLDRHLREVIAMIETRSPVELLAIGIGHDVTRYYRHSVTITHADRLAEAMTKELTALFGGA